jgi:hypothetical protein
MLQCLAFLAAALAAAVIVCAPLPSSAARMAPRPDAKACREAANGLISFLDAKTDNTALYRDTYGVVVNTCGPMARAPKSAEPPPGRDACHDLAAAMIDIIEDGKMNSAAFVTARDRFALACPPR